MPQEQAKRGELTWDMVRAWPSGASDKTGKSKLTKLGIKTKPAPPPPESYKGPVNAHAFMTGLC